MVSLDFSEDTFIVGVVTGGHLLSHFYLLVFPPLFPLLRADFGFSNTQLGVIISVISIGMLLQVPFGELVDRVGPKRVFIVGVGLTSTGVLFAGMATSYLMILLFAIVSGIGQSAFHPADYPLIEAASTPDNQGKFFSIHTFGGYAGFALAPVVTGTIGLLFDWRVALVTVGFIGMVYAVFAWIVLRLVAGPVGTVAEEEESSPRVGSLEAFMQPGILIMFVFFAVSTIGSKGLQTFTPLLAVDAFAFSENIGNTALTGFFTITAVGVLVGGVLADRFDPRYVIMVALSVAAVTTFVVVSGLFPIGPFVLISLFGVIGGAYGLMFASRDKLVSSLSAQGSTGRSFGFVFTGSSLGGLVSPAFMGAVIDHWTITLAFIIMAVFFVLAGLVAMSVRSRFSNIDFRPAESSD